MTSSSRALRSISSTSFAMVVMLRSAWGDWMSGMVLPLIFR